MRSAERTWLSVGGVVAAFTVVLACVAVFGAGNFRVHADQDTFHVPTVRQFQQQWPHVDLHDYPVATAPGYHLLMAAVARYVRDDLTLLRTIGAGFGLALVGLTAWGATRRNARSAWLALPLACSFYVLTSTVWLLPENAAWLLVVAGLLLALRAHGPRLYLTSAIVLATLVFVRQSHAWLIGVFVIAALTQPDEDDSNARLRLRLTPQTLLSTALAVLPAVAVLAWLISLWHGLSPPSFQPGRPTDLHQALPVGGVAPGAPGMMLAVLGGLGVPLLAWLWPARHGRRAALVGAVIGFVVGVLPASSYRFPDRRSGFWAIVQKLPTVWDRSPVFVGLATLGGVVVAVTLLRLRPRDRILFAAALAGMTLAQTMTIYLWQRYYEPFALIWLIFAAAAVPAAVPLSRKGWRIAGLAALVVGQLLATAYTLRNVQ